MPLNIAAMKRELPELVEEVFAMRPFWGWRRALEDAGISYDAIRVELTDTVSCLVCGIRRRSLGTHLWRTHGFEAGEYHANFPDAHAASETRRTQGPRGRTSVPHWEPLWSAEYVADRIRFFHDQGLPVSAEKVGGFDVSVRSAAIKHWGSWDRALVAAGLDPKRIRLAAPTKRYEPAEEVQRLIRARHRAGLPLNTKVVFRSDYHLMGAAIARFGSWRKALRAAGFEPRTVLLLVRNRPGVERRLLRRAQQIATMEAERRRRALATFRKRYWSVVYRKFGGWVKLARLIGVPPERLAINHSYTPEEVLAALKARKRGGLGVSARTLHEEARHLEYAARKHFGSLQAAYDRLGWGIVLRRRLPHRRKRP